MATTTLSRKDVRPRAARPAFPAAAIWQASTPATIAAATDWNDGSPGWLAWQNYLSQSTAVRVPPALGARPHALLWGAAGLSLDGECRQLLTMLGRAAGGHRTTCQTAADFLPHWLAHFRRPERDAALLECLAWALAMPAVARYASATAWWELLERQISLADNSQAVDLAVRPLGGQLLQVELPLTLAGLFPEIEPCDRLAAPARRRLGECLTLSAAENELLAANHLHVLRARLASWTRSLIWLSRLPSPEEPLPSLGTALLQVLRFTRTDGRQVFEDSMQPDYTAELFQAALQFVDQPDVRAITPPRPAPATQAKKRPAPPLPAAACHSEDAALGMLRRDWSTDGELMAVRYDDRAVQLELAAGREVMWSGVWELHVQSDGKPLEQRSDWDQVCWVSDKDVDYLELESRFSGGVRIQRQMLLARQDRLLYLADAVLGQADAQIHYRASLPLRPSVLVQGAEESREVALVGRRRLVVQPPALPEWRRDPRGGTLASSGTSLELVQQAKGRRLYAPLLIDLDPRRVRNPLTWRQLTVAEDRRSVPADVAVGYRIQIGKSQWLIYRSLGPRANRTVMGSNLVSEFMFARFSSEGEVQPLLEIE